MSNNYRPYIILGIIAAVIYFLFSFVFNNNSLFSWSETYKESSKEPYGTFVIHEMLKNYFPDASLIDIQESLIAELKSTPSQQSSYVFCRRGHAFGFWRRN